MTENDSNDSFDKAQKIQPFIEISGILIATIIPSVFLTVGASIQLIKLYSISPNYVRFFSISQLFSDSLLFFSIYLTTFFPTLLGFGFVYFLNKPIKTISKKLIPDEEFKIIILLEFLLAFSFYFLIKKIYPQSTALYSNLQLGALGMVLYSLSNIFFRKRKKIISEVEKQKRQERIEELSNQKDLPYLIIGLLIIFSFSVYSSAKIFLEKVKLSNQTIFNSTTANNLNTKNIHNKYKSKGLKDSLLYFNDQYIFLEVQKDTIIKKGKVKYLTSTKDIEILKFEEFFKKE